MNDSLRTVTFGEFRSRTELKKRYAMDEWGQKFAILALRNFLALHNTPSKNTNSIPKETNFPGVRSGYVAAKRKSIKTMNPVGHLHTRTDV